MRLRKCYIVSFVAVVILVAVVIGLHFMWTFNQFADNPALFVECREDGTVVLDTYQGRIEGPLAGVKWSVDKTFRSEAMYLVRIAQCDKVDWSSSSDGVTIWYEDRSGSRRNLNADLRKIARGAPINP